MHEENKLGLLTAEECVSEAMMFGFSRAVADQIYAEFPKLEYNQPHLSINELTEKATKSRCMQNAFEAVYFMATRHPELFDKYVIVTAKQGGADKFKHQPYDFHSYFLVRGKNGVFYAGSPANFAAENHTPIYTGGWTSQPSENVEYLNPLDKVFQGESIEAVMTQIREHEGSEWPTTEMITSGMSDKYQEPQFEYFTVPDMQDDGHSEDTIRVLAKVLEITTDFEPGLLPPGNTPIHMRPADTFRDVGSPIDPATVRSIYDPDRFEQQVIHELEYPSEVDHSDDPRWI